MSFFATRRARALAQSVAFITLGVSSAHAQSSSSWTGSTGGGDWNTASNWSAGVPDTTGESAILPAATAGARTMTLSAATTVSGIIFRNPSSGNATNLINPGAVTSMTLDSGVVGTPVTISVTDEYAGTIASASNIHSIQTGMVLNSNLIFNVAPRAADYAGIVLSIRGSAASEISGNFGVTKTGLGTLVFADTRKSFTGPFVVNQGRVRFNQGSGSQGGVSGASSVSVNPGGQLMFEQGASNGVNADVTLGAASAVVSLAGTGTIEPPNGKGSYQPGAIRVFEGRTLTLTNPVSLQQDAAINVSSSYNFTAHTLTQLGKLTLANQISGPGKFIAWELANSPLQAGQIVLANSNTYIGGTRVNLGTLVVSNANGGIANLGTGDVFLDGNSSQANNNSGGLPTLAAGKLTVQAGVANAIANTAALSLTGDTATYQGVPDSSPTSFMNAEGGIITLEAGVNETVGGLVLGGTVVNGLLIGGAAQTVPGTYGSSTSSATFKNDAYFRGNGVITLALGRTLYWDTNSETAGAGGAAPSGNWNGSTVNFNTNSTGGSGQTHTATTLSTDPVVFTAGTDGTGFYTVNVSGTQSAASVTVARGVVTLDGGTINSGAFSVASGAAGHVSSTITGGAASTITKTGSGTLKLAGANAHTGGTNVNGGMLVIANADALGTGALSLATGAAAQIQPSLPKAVSVGTINFADSTALDIFNNALVIKNSDLATVTGQIVEGYNNGDFLGGGITSSSAAFDPNFLTAIGYASNLDAAFTTFEGVSGLDDGDVLVKYTYYGDADLTGSVDLDDFNLFLAGYQDPANVPQTWIYGDFDYTGSVDLDDFNLFLAAYQANGAPLSALAGAVDETGLSAGDQQMMLAAIAAVPEPGTLGVLGMAACGLLAGRRNRRAV
jgi:fibronectin-binding autotransporter adhesin